MKKILIVLILLFIFSGFILINKLGGKVIFEDFVDKNDLETGFVTKVIDGDTIIIAGESIRFLGIDANEKGEKCYEEAKIRLEELVLNKEIELERDVKDKDRYKRLLRYIFIEENEGRINVNLQMVEEGLAIARFYEEKKYKEKILNAEKNARENKVGCKWA